MSEQEVHTESVKSKQAKWHSHWDLLGCDANYTASNPQDLN